MVTNVMDGTTKTNITKFYRNDRINNTNKVFVKTKKVIDQGFD